MNKLRDFLIFLIIPCCFVILILGLTWINTQAESISLKEGVVVTIDEDDYFIKIEGTWECLGFFGGRSEFEQIRTIYLPELYLMESELGQQIVIENNESVLNYYRNLYNKNNR